MSVKFEGVKSVKPLPLAASWAELRGVLSLHVERADKTKGSLWSPVEYYSDTTRGNRNVRFIEALVVDMDGEGLEAARLDGLEWFAYSTHSHRVEDPHYHLVLPLAERVPAGLWRAVWAGLHARLNVVGDPATKDPARIFYLPQHAPGEAFEFHQGQGVLLDTEFSLEAFDNPVADARPRRASNRGTRIQGVWPSEEFWHEPVDISRWDGLDAVELSKAMRAEWALLCQRVNAGE